MTNMQCYRHCPILTKDKKEKCQKNPEISVKLFATGCVFYHIGDWDDLQVDLHVNLHVTPCWLQNAVCRYRSILFRVQCLLWIWDHNRASASTLMHHP